MPTKEERRICKWLTESELVTRFRWRVFLVEEVPQITMSPAGVECLAPHISSAGLVIRDRTLYLCHPRRFSKGATMNDMRGKVERIGTYRGRGWLEALVVDTIKASADFELAFGGDNYPKRSP